MPAPAGRILRARWHRARRRPAARTFSRHCRQSRRRRSVNGIHDMGGMQGFGPVPREENEPVFHADWEKVVLTLSRWRGVMGLWTIDEQRHSVERMDPRKYLTASYYERWLDADERLLTERGVLTPEE